MVGSLHYYQIISDDLKFVWRCQGLGGEPWLLVGSYDLWKFSRVLGRIYRTSLHKVMLCKGDGSIKSKWQQLIWTLSPVVGRLSKSWLLLLFTVAVSLNTNWSDGNHGYHWMISTLKQRASPPTLGREAAGLHEPNILMDWMSWFFLIFLPTSQKNSQQEWVLNVIVLLGARVN
jgi:hypothetical protein